MSRFAVRSSLAVRACISARTAPTAISRAAFAPSATSARFAPAAASVQARWKTTAAPSKWAKNPLVSYEELKPITEQPSDDILLIDVREPDEVALGSIPSAVSLPLSELRGALDKNYNPGEFQKKFAFSKPLPEQNIIFFCRSGKRSATAAEWAGEHGYGNVRNYIGSWLDWSKREKERDGNDD